MHKKTNAKKPRLPDPFVDAFNRELGRLIHATARFDFNVGLQLRSLGDCCGRDVSKFLNPRSARLADRLTELEKLVSQSFKTAGPDALQAFSAWFAGANNARALRNDYAHGRWGLPGKWDELPSGSEPARIPMLAFVPLDWDMSPDRVDRSVYMTMDEFSEQVDQAEIIFNQFFQLTRKYEIYMGRVQPG